jgi:PAS domain S-box-containing protein
VSAEEKASATNPARDLSSLSFASPESDFTAPRAHDVLAAEKEAPYDLRWLSLSSPESDFTAARPHELAAELLVESAPSSSSFVAPHLSFASPESDFTAAMPHEVVAGQQGFLSRLLEQAMQHQTTLSFASPESDFTSSTHIAVSQDDPSALAKSSLFSASVAEKEAAVVAEVLASSSVEPPSLSFFTASPYLSFASPDSDFCAAPSIIISSSSQQQQQQSPLIHSLYELEEVTLAEATALSSEARVVTSAKSPFTITHVNGAWEDLCGFSACEAQGSTLELIQGPETKGEALRGLLGQLKQGRRAEAKLVNYTKSGKRFVNQLEVVPVKDEATGELTHFLGVLKLIAEEEEARAHQGAQMLA